ncbi:MAG: acetylglutamate kinase [Phycisphaerae bacterium]|nr:acetylglutamate kinase [Phycisphaerae bacterium]
MDALKAPLKKSSVAMHPLVIKIGGALLDEPATAVNGHLATIAGIVDLHREAQARGSGVVLVHGGGVAVDRHLARLGVTTERIDGIRVTPPDVVEEIVGVLAGRVNTRLLGLLIAAGAKPVGLSLGDGCLCACRKSTRYAFDPGAVGEITGGDPSVIHTLIDGGFLPVVSSIGLDAEGQCLNVNADDAAAAIARIVSAQELVLLTDVAGVLDKHGRVIPYLNRDAIEGLIADSTIRGGMIAKVRGALEAAEQAGVPVTIASWKDPASITARQAMPACTRIAGAIVAPSR